MTEDQAFTATPIRSFFGFSARVIVVQFLTYFFIGFFFFPWAFTSLPTMKPILIHW